MSYVARLILVLTVLCLGIGHLFSQQLAVGIRFREVPGGQFTMGDLKRQGSQDERPLTKVSLDTFFIATTEVTQTQWTRVMGNNPAQGQGRNNPVESISWYEAVIFCNTLSRLDGLEPPYTIIQSPGQNPQVTWNQEANGYRLPTEAEWEFAARGSLVGITKNYSYAGGNYIDDLGWVSTSLDAMGSPLALQANQTQVVATKAPNNLGLYDMSGNVWEWVWDRYGFYSGLPSHNPTGASSGPARTMRGGSWFSLPGYARVSARMSLEPSGKASNIGFRIARNP